ncbi:MAG TPA: trypsin-like peptidase domain-containing protein [Longimicrobium sp.]|jgi:V8-like Glu-specific endopeptidase
MENHENEHRRAAFLNDLLADLYPTVEESRRVVVRAELRPAFIRFNAAAIINWFEIIEEAKRRSKMDDLVAVALADFPENPMLQALHRHEPAPVAGPDVQRDLPWHGAPGSALEEKIIGSRSTLLPISFLEVGLARSRAVSRIVLADGSSGTGFLLNDALLLTNHHVVQDAVEAENSVAEFNYQLTVRGNAAPVERLRLDPTRAFATSAQDDWTIVGLERVPADAKPLELRTVEIKVGDFVSIIQHPAGGYKQIGMFHNTVAYVGEGRVQYLTDTLPGSSGSPVFNEHWQMVALHHSGGFIREPGTKASYYRNEGIHINRVIDGLRSVGLTTR